jgi:hypothetical protein
MIIQFSKFYFFFDGLNFCLDLGLLSSVLFLAKLSEIKFLNNSGQFELSTWKSDSQADSSGVKTRSGCALVIFFVRLPGMLIAIEIFAI